MSEILKVQNLKKYYGGKGNIAKAVNNISFSVTKGEYIGVMGASGSGKTTLLNCISTIDSATSGHIFIAGKDVTKMKTKDVAKFRREELGFIFQDFNLLDTLTGHENIALALTILKEDPKAIEEKISKVTKILNIENILSKYPYQISGGEAQRVAAARALVTNPTLILADEPTGKLDSKSSKMLLESFKKLNQEIDSTILMVTHDAFAASYCKRVLFMKDGKIFNEILRGDESRKEFFDRIIEVISLLGGDLDVE